MRNPRLPKTLLSLSLAAAFLLAPTEGRAQANDGTTWGYWIVGGSVILGTTATLLGLNIDCSPNDFDCHREASVLIWGGIGFASAGTLTGLTIVQWGERKRALTLSSAKPSSLPISPYSRARGFESGERGFESGERGFESGERGFESGERGSLLVLTLTLP